MLTLHSVFNVITTSTSYYMEPNLSDGTLIQIQNALIKSSILFCTNRMFAHIFNVQLYFKVVPMTLKPIGNKSPNGQRSILDSRLDGDSRRLVEGSPNRGVRRLSGRA